MKKNYKCSICGSDFTSQNRLDNHELSCVIKNPVKIKADSRVTKQMNIHNQNGVLIQPINLDKPIVTNGKKILFDKDVFIQVIKQSAGSVQWLATVYGVSWHTINKYLKENPDLSLLLEKQQKLIVDIATDNVYKAVLEGNLDISKWVLSHLSPKFNDKLKIESDIKLQVLVDNNKIELL